MNIDNTAHALTEKVKCLSSFPPCILYTVLAAGMFLFFFSSSIITWKRTSPISAQGKIASIELHILTAGDKLAQTKDSDDKKSIREDIKDYRDDLKDARKNLAKEKAQSQSGIWIYSMVRMLGASLSALGLLLIAALGSTYEKAGALIALGFFATHF